MMKIISKIAATVGAILVLAGVYLFVPPPQHVRAQFADQGAWATAASVTASGATTVTLTLNNVSSLSDIKGVNIGFNPDANSVGPVSIVVTGSAGTTAATALQRPSSLGLVALSLNELWAAETTSVKYNGSVFVLTSNVDMRPIGDVCENRGSSAPRGCLIEDGSCVSQTQFAPLYGLIGTTYGSCSTGNFRLPLSNGTAFMAMDGQGVNGSAGRLTTASCSSPNSLGQLCGTETKTLTATQIPTINSSFSGGTSQGSMLFSPVTGFGITLYSPVGGGSDQFLAFQPGAVISQLALAVTGTGSSSNTGGGAHPVLNPVLLGIRAIKY